MPYDLTDEKYREYHVTPRYLAGSSGIGDEGLQPVRDWPKHHPEDLGNLVVSSPDGRIKIGFFGDDYVLWKISVYEDPFAAPRWSATFNQNTPPEIVAGLTTALASDYRDGTDRFLARPSPHWVDGARPLLEADWKRGAAEVGTVELVSPDQQAGLFVDLRPSGMEDETKLLWAGPPSWGSRAEVTFTSRTPAHLVAATAAAMADPTPVIRERWSIHRKMEHLVRLTPVEPVAHVASGAPTPLDVRRTAVTQAVRRATSSDLSTELRVRAAQSRTAIPRTSGAVAPAQPTRGIPPSARPTVRPRR